MKFILVCKMINATNKKPLVVENRDKLNELISFISDRNWNYAIKFSKGRK